MDVELKICSFNCQGLGDPRKRKDVFNFLRAKQCNIYFIQDTHFEIKLEPYVRAEWGLECIFNSYNSQSRGVGILFNKNFEYTCKIKGIDKDEKGNLLIVDIEINSRIIRLVNVYGPNNDDPNFYKAIKDKCEDKQCIMGGDWNVVLDTEKDCFNYKHINNPKARDQILENIETLHLTDIWRAFNIDENRYTWRRKSPIKQAHLDYFLISEYLFEDVQDCVIEAGYRSDHSLVMLTLGSLRQKQRNSFWKFNNSLLKDKEYGKVIKETITKIKQQYMIPLYNSENINDIPHSELQFYISDQLWFETLLMEIRGKTILYASFRKKQTREKENKLLEDINKLETNIENIDIESLDQMIKELVDIRKTKIEGAFIRSRARWVEEGEKLTDYFCNMENINFVNKVMNRIEKPDGNVIIDTSDIVEETQCFYEKLYASRESNLTDFDFESSLSDGSLPKLKPEEASQLNSEIKYNELCNAMKRMKNNKSPGSDGLTTEFFKFFWGD